MGQEQKMKTRTAFFLLLIIAFAAMAQADWELVMSSTSYLASDPIEFWPGSSPYEVSFMWVDDLTSENLILYSPDTFQTFDTILVRTGGFDVHPTDPMTILALDSGSNMLKTTDRGATWDTVLTPCYGNISYSYSDPNYVWATPLDGSGDAISFSSDGGMTWNNATGDYVGHPSNVYALNGSSALIDDGSSLYKTTNGGTNWIEVLTDSLSFELFWRLSVSRVDSNRVAVAFDNTIFVSEDAGDTWEACTTFTGYNWGIECDPYDPDKIILGNDNGVFRSSDFGESWELWESSTMLGYPEEFGITVIGGERRYYASTSDGIFKRTGEMVSGGPRLSGYFPEEGDWVSEDTTVILVFSDMEGIDASTAVIDVNGTEYTTSDAELSSSGDSIIFRPSTPWADGDVTVVLVGIEDTGGEASADSGSSFTFHVDKTAPEMLFYEPDSGEILDEVPTGIMLVFDDVGCGNTAETWDLSDGSVTIGSWTDGVMMEGPDTIFIDFVTSGIDISSGDTVELVFRGWDDPDIGEPNILEFDWWFTIATGIDEDNLPDRVGLSVFPNPFNSACRITAPKDAEIQIFDIHGREVLSLPPETNVWRPSKDTPSGIYSIRISTPEETKILEAVLLK